MARTTATPPAGTPPTGPTPPAAPPPPRTGRPENVSGNPFLWALLELLGLAIILALLGTSYWKWSALLYQGKGLALNTGPLPLLLAAAYLVASFKQVAADQVAGAYFYGKALVRLAPGPHFVPFGLMQIRSESRLVQEFQAPGEPEKVFKGDDGELLPEGMVRPIRAVTRAPKPDDGENQILDVQMTLTLSFVVQYAIVDIFDYVANFESPATVEMQLRDIGEVTLAERVTQNTPRTFIEQLGSVNADLITAVKDRFQNSGINIISVRLISPDVSHGVSTALASIPIAKATAQATIIAADAEKIRLTREGEGTAAATLADRLANAKGALADLEARARGGKKMMKDLKVDGPTVVASETVRNINEKTDVIVVGGEGGMRDLMGLVKGAQAGLNSGKGGTTP